MVECSAVAVLKFLIFEHGTLHFHVAPDPGNPHPLLSMGISLSRFNSSPTSSRKPFMIPSQFRDSLLSSISIGVMAHTHHSVLSHIDHLLPLLASYLSVHGSFVSPIWL